jgi:hypothetical protein
MVQVGRIWDHADYCAILKTSYVAVYVHYFFRCLGLGLFDKANQSRPDGSNGVSRSVRGRLQSVGLYEPACSHSRINVLIPNLVRVGHCGSVE